MSPTWCCSWRRRKAPTAPAPSSSWTAARPRSSGGAVTRRAWARGTLVRLAYTEPEAGTDLASLRTRAVRDGDHYIVNGQKIFTSGADQADYVWLAARTDPDAARHRGISVLIVDTSAPGFKVTPLRTIFEAPSQ